MALTIPTPSGDWAVTGGPGHVDILGPVEGYHRERPTATLTTEELEVDVFPGERSRDYSGDNASIRRIPTSVLWAALKLLGGEAA